MNGEILEPLLWETAQVNVFVLDFKAESFDLIAVSEAFLLHYGRTFFHETGQI